MTLPRTALSATSSASPTRLTKTTGSCSTPIPASNLPGATSTGGPDPFDWLGNMR
jgi:hypothetical protein